MASNYVFDEDRWRGVMQDAFSKAFKGNDDRIAASIFDVPTPLLKAKPEVYTPKVFAVGPCHKHRPELNDAEKYKAAYALEAEKTLKHLKFDELVNHFIGIEGRIRAQYERYLDFKPGTLAWTMAIDACFLLEFFRKRSHEEEDKSLGNLSHDRAWMKKAVTRDILMLENQIPLFLLAEVLKFAHISEQEANAEISSLLTKFIEDVSPFTTAGGSPTAVGGHLLGFLYQSVAPNWDGADASIALSIEHEGPKADVPQFEDLSKVQQGCGIVRSWLPRRLRNSPPVKFLASPPVRKVVELCTRKPFPAKGKENSKPSKPSIHNIITPSATKLARVGVKFVAAPNGIGAIHFDADSLEFHLPAITMDDVTEVVMRNLIAYEVTTVRTQHAFTRYTEVMSGIMATEEDVDHLVEREIIRGDLSSSRALDVWEGMDQSIRATEVPRLDEVVMSVNEFYDDVWSVKTRRVIKKRVRGSWRLLALLAVVLLLLMTAFRTFCSAYTCSRWDATEIVQELVSC